MTTNVVETESTRAVVTDNPVTNIVEVTSAGPAGPPGGSLTIQDNGVDEGTLTGKINFAGSTVSVSNDTINEIATVNVNAATPGANTNITSLGGMTGGISTPDFIQFDTAAAATGGVGKLLWNDTDGTLEFQMKGGNVTLQVGQEEVLRVTNQSGSTMVDGQVVYITGSTGNHLNVTLSQANSEATSSKTLAVVTETIPNNQSGFATTSGLVRNLNTSALTEGAAVWLSPTVPGGLTSTKPVAPNHAVLIGWCVKQHASVGVIYVHIANGYELEELHNVLITSVQDKQVIRYDSATSLWKNVTLSPSLTLSGDASGSATFTDLSSATLSVTVADNSHNHTIANVTNLQTSLDAKAPLASPTFTGTVTLPSTTSIGTVSSAEIGYLDGVTSAIQTQLDSKFSASGTLGVSNGGTGQTSYTDGQLLIGNSTGNTLTKATLTAGSGISITNGAGSITIAATGGGGGSGTVTSVDVSGGTTGLTFSGGPIATSGTITMAGTLGVSNGGTGAVNAGQARTNLGATTAGANLFTIANPSAVTYLRFNADNTVSTLSAASFRTAIGATTIGGSMFTLANPSAITFPQFNANNTVSALTAVNFRTAIGAAASGTNSDITSLTGLTTALSVAQGGTGQTSYTDGQILIGNSTGNTLTKSTITAGSGISITNGSGSITIAATGGTGTVTSIDVSGGTTGLTATGGPISTSGTITLGGTLAVTNGGTGATGAVAARSNLGAAASGANSDITSITGLTTALSVAQGGTGQTTYTDGQILIGNSTGNTLTKTTLTAGSGITITNGAGSITIAATGGGGGSGTVTSVDVSGGATGLTFSGGPITTSGTITMAGTLGVANGGTGTSTTFSAGSIIFADASGVYSQDNANLFWDDTNNRLGIGTSSPAYPLDINGSARIGGALRGTSGSVASAATITPTSDTTNQYNVTALATGAAIAAPSGTPVDGQKLTLRIKDNGVARLLSWTTGVSGAYREVGATLPGQTVANKTLYVGCIYNSSDLRWDVVAVSQEA